MRRVPSGFKTTTKRPTHPRGNRCYICLSFFYVAEYTDIVTRCFYFLRCRTSCPRCDNYASRDDGTIILFTTKGSINTAYAM